MSSRRLPGALTALATCAVACSTPLPGPPEWNRAVQAPSDSDAEIQRAQCAFKVGALAKETQGQSHPNGSEIPIDHIVVLMMENRSFDHYFQHLPDDGQPDVEVAPAGFTNPDLDGNPVAPFRDTQLCFADTDHGWNAVHRQIDGGKMDGFVVTNEGMHELPMNASLDMLSGRRAMGNYLPSDLPFMYWAAREYAIADHYHASVPGPTLPNRMYLYAASSFGKAVTALPDPATVENILFDHLVRREVDWTVYRHETAGFAVFIDRYVTYLDGHHIRKIPDFYADAKAGTLPAVSFVDPDLSKVGANDEHPPAVMQLGQRFLSEVVTALTQSPAWPRTALFIVYDEHGGLYDHVVPPKACPPDAREPELAPGAEPGRFDQLGVRVPMLVVSPFARKHFVGHRVYDHTSIVRFIEARFVLPALSARDANAEAPWELFDFHSPPDLTPPVVPMPSLDDARVASCAQIFTK
jgi:phospholipase C